MSYCTIELKQKPASQQKLAALMDDLNPRYLEIEG